MRVNRSSTSETNQDRSQPAQVRLQSHDGIIYSSIEEPEESHGLVTKESRPIEVNVDGYQWLGEASPHSHSYGQKLLNFVGRRGTAHTRSEDQWMQLEATIISRWFNNRHLRLQAHLRYP